MRWRLGRRPPVDWPAGFRDRRQPPETRRDRDRGRLHFPVPIAVDFVPGPIVRESLLVRHGPYRRCPRLDALDVTRRSRGFRRDRWRAARQGDPRLVADDRGPLGRIEPADEADVLFRSPGLVPRDPDAVRVTELRLAVVPRKLLGGERVFSIRRAAIRIAIVLIEGVHDQRAVDPQRRVPVRTEEHQSAAETPCWGTIRTLEQDLTPDGHHLGRRLRLVFAQRKPLRRSPPIQLRTTDEGRQADNS